MVNGVLVVRGYISEGGLFSPSKLGRLMTGVILLWVAYRYRLQPGWFCLFFVGVFFESIAGMRFGQVYGVVFGFITVYRLAYIWLLFTVLLYYANQDVGVLGKFLKYNVVFISLSIIFAHFTGLGNSTYGWGFGTKGFFASGNALGIYLGGSTLTLLAMKHYRIYTDIGKKTYLIAFLGIVLIGSKAAFLLAMLVLFFWVWFSVHRRIFILIFIVFAVGFSSYILDVASVAFDVIIRRYHNSNSIVEFLSSGRIDYVLNAAATLNEQKSELLRILLGGGSFLSFQNPAEAVLYDTLEMDWADIFFMYGLVGLLFYCTFFISGIFFLKDKFFLLFVWIILLLHSVIAGHVIWNGMSIMLLSYLLALGRAVQSNHKKAERLNRTLLKG
tara:strand:- start:8395 stop:9552 length:1158 start_codon:yes stop_codon:yes gene_type:complete